MKILKEKVKYFMKIGVSLKSISHFANVHYTTLSKWINNERNMNIENQEKVKEALKIIVNKLLEVFNE